MIILHDLEVSFSDCDEIPLDEQEVEELIEKEEQSEEEKMACPS
jgi:hypothetical protein